MNATRTLPPRGSWMLRETPPIYHATAPPPRTRVAVFGSFMGGYHVLKELLGGPLAESVKVVGVATDDPTQPFVHAEKRLWRYPHTRDDELLVPRFAAAHALPVFTGRAKTPEFFAVFLDDWRPALCLMATFGQKLPTALINYPSLGFYNFHHSAETWPSYPGPDPISAMVRDRRKHLVRTIHKVTDVIDGGEFVARSHRVAIPDGINAIGMHRITWPQMGPFIRYAVGTMLDRAGTEAAVPALLLQEQAILCCTGDRDSSGERLAA
jgi:methionyl-tRNA formyltransferase